MDIDMQPDPAIIVAEIADRLAITGAGVAKELTELARYGLTPVDVTHGTARRADELNSRAVRELEDNWNRRHCPSFFTDSDRGQPPVRTPPPLADSGERSMATATKAAPKAAADKLVISKADAVTLLTACKYKVSDSWDVVRLGVKLQSLHSKVDDTLVIEDKRIDKLCDKVVQAGVDGLTIVVEGEVEEAPTKPAKAAAKNGKAPAKAKAPAEKAPKAASKKSGPGAYDYRADAYKFFEKKGDKCTAEMLFEFADGKITMSTAKQWVYRWRAGWSIPPSCRKDVS